MIEALETAKTYRQHTGGRVFGKKLALSEGQLDQSTAPAEKADMTWLGALSAQAQDWCSTADNSNLATNVGHHHDVAEYVIIVVTFSGLMSFIIVQKSFWVQHLGFVWLGGFQFPQQLHLWQRIWWRHPEWAPVQPEGWWHLEAPGCGAALEEDRDRDWLQQQGHSGRSGGRHGWWSWIQPLERK